MSRVIVIVACGLMLSACSSSLPSFDFLRGSPPTEALRIESEPPGADARTPQGQSCRTPCELTVPAGTETSVAIAMNGYAPQTVPIRNELPEGVSPSEASPRLQPNPVYVELTPARPAPPARQPPRKKKATSARAKAPPPPGTAPPATQSQATAPDPNGAYPAGYPWPDPQQQH